MTDRLERGPIKKNTPADKVARKLEACYGVQLTDDQIESVIHTMGYALVPTDHAATVSALRAENERLKGELIKSVALLELCRKAIACLPVDALGIGTDPFCEWPIRDELVSNLDNFISRTTQPPAKRSDV